MSKRLQWLRQRILLPIGLAALFVGTAGDAWLHNSTVFTAGFVVVAAALVAMVVVVWLEKRAD